MIDITPDQLKQEIEADKSIFLKVWKKGCGPCKLSEPATDRLEKTYENKLNFFKIEAGEYPEMFDITGTDILPTFFIFKAKALKEKKIGFKGIKKLTEMIDRNL